uniref:Putative DegT/DnrJ/EryC1/StrS family aminotransferase n=1 Tax=Magnetococcus massalia (strain MO-1) TaxID=451514 RepID=A0A1S7LDW3_MAGMO|nr:putative DegT/DnrJ/EryC1/StrS family aminotransferase [Candidatus Magnetococcus massalia]
MIPYCDLSGQNAALKAEIMQALEEVVDSGAFILGPKVKAFEVAFAHFCGAEQAIATSSGTSALQLALSALGVGPGDEVITTPLTFVATVAAILYCGAKPVLVDVDPATWNLDPNKLEAAVTPKTKVILPVHLHGQMAQMDAIMEIAAKHGISVVEDAAQAHGATFHDHPAGSMGALGCFSFYPGKNLGAYGEGGAVTTSDPQLAERVAQLRDWGLAGRHNHVVRGHNYRMDGMQGAVLGIRLKYLERWNEKRQELAKRYDELLAPLGIQHPAPPAECQSVYHVYAVCVPQRDEVQQELLQRGVQTNIHYPKPVHLQPAYSDLGYGPGDLPHAEDIASHFLSLPIYPDMKPGMVDEVVEKLHVTLQEMAVS